MGTVTPLRLRATSEQELLLLRWLRSVPPGSREHALALMRELIERVPEANGAEIDRLVAEFRPRFEALADDDEP